MGTVAMGEGGSIRFEGSLITQTVYCLYCDKCGSFDISKRTLLKVIVAVLFVTMTTSLFVPKISNPSEFGFWLACFSSQLLLILITGLINIIEIPRCRKCGNRHFTKTNALGYPEKDSSNLDVPFEKTIKLCYDDY